MRKDQHLRFEENFYCISCKTVCKVRTYRAVVESSGYPFTCAMCGQKYVVTTDGALPLSAHYPNGDKPNE